MSSALSLLDCQTRVSPGTFFPQLGGNNGGGSAITVSTLTVSSITGANSEPVVVTNGLEMAGGAQLTFIAGGGIPDIDFSANNGALTGVSSINGQPFSASGSQANISTPTTTGGFFPAGADVNLNPGGPASVVNGKWYLGSVEITDMSFVTPPNATDCFSISLYDGVGTANLGTFNMSMISTNRGILGDCGFSATGPFEAQSTIVNFIYSANATAPSTFIVTGNSGWLMPLS